MKKIICLLGPIFSTDRKNQIIDSLREYNNVLNFPFSIDLFQNSISNDSLEDYDYAITCFPPTETLKSLRALEFILSLNAGVDDTIFNLPNSKVRLGRMVHPSSINRMFEYIIYCMLDYFLLMDRYRSNQNKCSWDRSKPFSIMEKRIGIMGLGKVGGYIADKLINMGYEVIGLANSEKSFPYKTYQTKDIDIFLSQINLLVNAMPLTKKTTGILNAETLNLMPLNSALINIGRGAHLIEEDLLAVLSTNRFQKVYLDVFNEEPLPVKHPFWKHPKIFLTPHISGIYDSLEMIKPALEQCYLFFKHKIILNPVDIRKEY